MVIDPKSGRDQYICFATKNTKSEKAKVLKTNLFDTLTCPNQKRPGAHEAIYECPETRQVPKCSISDALSYEIKLVR
jgi:hypothetical protein